MPDNEWNPNAPDLKDDFNKASQVTNESLAEEKARGEEAMAQEIERLERERATPKPSLDYTIGGTVEQDVNTQIEAQREAFIKEMRESLDNSTDRKR